MGIHCRFLAWNVATALSILGFVPSGCSEVRLTRPEFKKVFAWTQKYLISVGVNTNILTEWPEVQAEAESRDDRVDIPGLPKGARAVNFSEYLTEVQKYMRQCEGCSDSLISRLDNEWGKAPEDDEDRDAEEMISPQEEAEESVDDMFD